MKFQTAFVTFLLVMLGPITWGQNRCATMDYLKQEKQYSLERHNSFESWLEREIRQTVERKNTLEGGEEVLVIPVVVHIIHNGEELGENENIRASQVYSQFEVLNQDYRRTNTDRFNTPPMFKAVAVDTRIEFRPAVLDPSGNTLEEPGIHRVQGERTEWSNAQLDSEVKPVTSWDPNRYLNIWVADLQGSTLGYSTWPKEPGISGVPAENSPLEEEGIVVSYHVFGSNFTDRGTFEQLNDIRYDRGRTTSHEIGHYFGLLHPWGFTGGCGDDDFCGDTPTTSRNRDDIEFPCSFPDVQNTCTDGSGDLPDMFQNFMDYTTDECMNLFTLDQQTRMRAVILGAPRRASLLSAEVIEPHFAPDALGLVFLNDSVVELQWRENARNTAYYQVERSESAQSGFIPLATTSWGVPYLTDTLTMGEHYYYRVQAVNAAGATTYSNLVFSGSTEIPGIPTNLTATALTADSIVLSWNLPNPQADKIVLEWSFDEQTGFQEGKILEGGTTSLGLRGLLDGQLYFFKIRAENALGSSAYSNTAQVQTLPFPPDAPQNLTVGFLKDIRKFELNWDNDAEDVTSHIIYRKQLLEDTFEEIALLTGMTRSFIDEALVVPTGAQYAYMVRAVNEGGVSGYSNIAEFDAITALQDEPAPESTVIYPNPASQKVTVMAVNLPAGEVVVLLMDIAGREVWRSRQLHKGSPLTWEIPVQGFKRGMYLIRLVHKGGQLSKKLLLQPN